MNNILENLKNINESMGNKFYKVIEPFEVFGIVSHQKTGDYVGAARLLKPVFQKIKLQKGDELQILVGGTFAIVKKEKKYYEVSDVEYTHSIHGRHIPKWPMNKLKEIDEKQASELKNYSGYR